MTNLGVSKSIFYFNEEGKINIEATAILSLERARDLNIKDIIVFTANGDGAFLLKKLLNPDDNIKIHAATFPYKQVFYSKKADNELEEILPETSLPEVRQKLKDEDINLIQGIMPLQDIIIPGSKDVKTQTINYTLSTISGGLRLCIQALLMAADGGHIEPCDQVIAMSADTSIVARSSLSTWMFNPTKGLVIQEIICKPSHFTLRHDT